MTLFSLIVAYVAASVTLGTLAGDSSSALRFVFSLVVAAAVAAVVYTAIKDGPRGLFGMLRRK